MFRSFKDLTGAAPCCRLRAFSSILVLLAVALPAMTGCQEKPEPGPGPEPESQVKIVLEGSDSIELPADGGYKTIRFTVNHDWTVTADAKWIHLSPTGGTASEQPASVNVGSVGNSGAEPRSGNVTITAGDKTRVIKVTQGVRPPDPVHVTGVKVSPESAVMLPGETLQLTAVVEPENAANKNYRWMCYQYNVVSVSEDGLVTALEKGEAKVMALTEDQSRVASCQITVKALPPTAVDLGLNVKWGSFNLSVTDPWAFAFHYSWGQPVYKNKRYSLDDYMWWSDGAFSKYNKKDGKVLVDQEDDAAFNDFGEGWRIPTKTDFENLLATRSNSGYKWEWSIMEGIYRGWKITYLKNGNSIFLPAGGITSENICAGQFSWGYYWSSERLAGDETQAYVLYFDEQTVEIRQRPRQHGCELRAVCVK